MIRPKVYIETTVVSYLVALPTEDIIQMAHQEITRQWWERRDRFDLYVSRAVVAEARRGNPDAAAGVWTRFVGFRAWRAAAESSMWQERWFGTGRYLLRLGWMRRTWGSPRCMAWSTW